MRYLFMCLVLVAGCGSIQQPPLDSTAETTTETTTEETATDTQSQDTRDTSVTETALDVCVFSGNERCNGVDDNCNGEIDEGFLTISCGVGACFRELPFCLNGNQQTCTEGTPTQETCNGLDDDCNGIVDDNNAFLSCSAGQCLNGACGCPSDFPLACATGSCVDPMTNTNHCGTCRSNCGTGPGVSCNNGVCSSCTSDRPSRCGIVCTNVQTDPQNCGDCFNICPTSAPLCVNGVCSTR